jgi:hypothetical protein
MRKGWVGNGTTVRAISSGVFQNWELTIAQITYHTLCEEPEKRLPKMKDIHDQ